MKLAPVLICHSDKVFSLSCYCYTFRKDKFSFFAFYCIRCKSVHYFMYVNHHTKVTAKLEANMIDPNKTSKSVSDEDKNTEAISFAGDDVHVKAICLFCKRRVLHKCNVSNNQVLMNALASLTIEYYPLPRITDYGCFNCVRSVMVLAEQRERFQTNIMKSRANYFVRHGNKKMCAKYLAETKSQKINLFPATSGLSNLKITDVRTITETESMNGLQHHVAEKLNVTNDETVDYSSNRLLDVMYEQPESVLATESGGNVHDSSTRSVSSTTNTSLYRCQYCSRTYAKQGFLKKHEKRHNLRNLARSRRSHFECSHCEVVMDSLSVLRKHERIHRETMKCSYCDERFSIRTKLDLHEAICLGKIAATQENGRRQYYTRSQKTAVPSDSESDVDSEIYPEPIYDDRVKRWISEVDNDVVSRYTSPGTLSRRSTFSSVHTWFSSVSDITDRETEADSTTSSVFSERVRLIGKDSVRNIKKTKKRKLYPHITNKQWICPQEGCGYMDASLDSLMSHDIETHEPMALFFCKKCRGRFVRRFYYEQHLKFQSYGRWVCCLCETVYQYESDLKYHFEEHNESDRHSCDICNFTFITDHELQKHLCTTNHLNRKKMRRCIFLERHSYPYAKEVPSEPEGPKPYKSTIKILKLMDQERNDKFRYLSWRSSWKQGTIFHMRENNRTYNCAKYRLLQP